MMHQVEEVGDVPYELKHWRSFWTDIFKEWEIIIGNADDLPLNPVTLAENRVKVGKLKTNHPSGSKETSDLDIGVKVGHPMENHPPSVDPGPPGPWRLQGCPVYMTVSPAAQSQLLQPIWKDEKGNFVSPRHVETDIPVGEYIDLAVLRFDRAATSRIKEYNTACITNAARRRLMHFAAAVT
ncbi:hypothetical protein FACUT_1726 [Fusarium acutatum]|uniref:Uncharacterized protein n=1 Tax=Fusarium acutatum TaxID=78861 RepID=A0A8H4K4Y9_9HYPO|nr:hypothetical protein FACUT_1726 [Fusarium acutatum]